MDEARSGSAQAPRPGRKKADRHLLIACTTLYTHFLLGTGTLATFKASSAQRPDRRTAASSKPVPTLRQPRFDHVVHQFVASPPTWSQARPGLPGELWPTEIADAGGPDPRHQHRPRQRPPRDRGDHPRQVAPRLRHRVLAGLSHHHPRHRPGRTRPACSWGPSATPTRTPRFVTDLTVPRPPTTPNTDYALEGSTNVSGRLTSVARIEDRYRIRLRCHRRQPRPQQDDGHPRRRPRPTLDARAPRPTLTVRM